jgi:hypothetical protein
LSAFGWTFASGQLGEAWGLQQLEATLRFSGKAAVDHLVAERLASLANHCPAANVLCLELMVHGTEEGWQIHHWASHAEAILNSALQSGDGDAVHSANVLINRLGARGFFAVCEAAHGMS